MSALLALVALLAATPTDSTFSAANVADYQRLLDRYLVVTSAPGAPLETRVDYARLPEAEAAAALAALTTAIPSRMTPRARVAWAIDTYNLAVITRVEQAMARGKALASVRDIPGFFKTNALTIEGHSYSLDAFEEHFVFLDLDRESHRPIPGGLDPRAHFGLVCAARGCPPLQPRAFLPESLDLQLDGATRATLASPNHLRWDPKARTLAASAIFDWYQADFGGPNGAFAYIGRYAPKPVRVALGRGVVNKITAFIPWDWKLNAAPTAPR